MKKTLIAFLIAGIFDVPTISVAANEASNAAGADRQPTQSLQIEEVVITARKVEESQQSVPVSVAAFSGKDLQESVILSVSGLGEHVTGLVATTNSQGGAPTFSIRATKTDSAIDGGVAVYIDDVPLVSTIGIVNGVYDLGSVEVLKGPQGTLFGVNTTGGTISFRPNKPTDKFEGYADVGIGNYNQQNFEGMINIPVNDVLQLRLAGNSVRRDGVTKNLTPTGGLTSRLGNDKHESLRFSARLKPTASIVNDIVADYYHEDDIPRQPVPQAFTPLSTLGPADVYGPRTVSLGNNPSGIDLPNYNKAKIWGIADTLNWEVNDNVSIKNVLGYRDDNLDTFEHSDGSYLALVPGRTKQWNTQWTNDFTLRLNTDDKRLRYTGGVYLSHIKKNVGWSYESAQNFGLLGFLSGVPDPNLVFHSRYWFTRDMRSRSVYSTVDYDLSKELTVTFGLRYNWDSGKYSQQAASGIGPLDRAGQFFPSPGIPCDTSATAYFPGFDAAQCKGTNQQKWKAPSYNFVLTDKFAEKSLVYFKASGGYLAGGFNDTLREPQYQTFLPEKTNEFEAGLKSDWELWGRPIRTNIDAFYGNSTNKQELQNGTYDGGLFSWQAILNSGSITFYGTDMEIKFYPTDNLELSGSWTHINNQYDNFTFPAIGDSLAQNLSGKSTAQVPVDTLNLAASYTWPLSSDIGKLSSTISTYYRSLTTYHDVIDLTGFPANADTAPEFWTTSFSTEWNGIMGSRFDARFWVSNLFNKTYVVYAQPQTGIGYWANTYGDPRFIGANLRYNF